MTDELVNVIKKIRTTGIKGERARPQKRPEVDLEMDTVRAIRAATLLLSGGDWVQVKRLYSIARIYGISYDSLAAFLEMAESDSGFYCCLPDERTPTLAPDESRRKVK